MKQVEITIQVPSATARPLIAHVPHSSTRLTPEARRRIVLDDAALQSQLIRLTDWHTDDLFAWMPDLGGTMFVNQVSRLVFDPERFADDKSERMADVGQGVVYTHTTDGSPLATISPTERAARIRELYDPYHETLTALVQSTLDRFGTALILDCHSFPSVPLPSELDKSPDRPDICVGVDEYHTPEALACALERAFRAEGFAAERNRPFAGALVPLRFWKTDPRVQSVMIEVRRDLYCDESTGERGAGFDATRDTLRRAVASALDSVLSAD